MDEAKKSREQKDNDKLFYSIHLRVDYFMGKHSSKFENLKRRVWSL